MIEKNVIYSIIVPEYNCPIVVAEKCFSCFEKYQDDLELILVDDGSKEPYRSDIMKIAEKKPFIRILLQEHKGVSAARNHGLEEANGTYVIFCDIDDVLDLETMMHAADHMPQEVDLLYCDYYKVRANRMKRVSFDSVPTLSLLMKSPTLYGTVWGKIYRRKILENVSFNESLTFGEDTDFLVKLFSEGTRIGISNDAFYIHYINKVSTSKKEVDMIRDLESFYQSLRDRISEKEINEKYAADCLIVNLIVLMNYFVFVPGTGSKRRRKILKDISADPMVKEGLDKYSPDFLLKYKLIAFLLKNGRYELLHLIFKAYQIING